MFYQRIRKIQRDRGSLLCIGLDPDTGKVPDSLRRNRNSLLEFNRRIIDATQDLVCAYKLNLAFYEVGGKKGWETLEKTIAMIPGDVLKIGDGKRGDIGNTADMYARAMFDELRFDAATVNPYMGSDSVEPFLRDPHKGAFVLALTSNTGARDFQYRKSNGRSLYEDVVVRVKKWNTSENCGLVVGATRPSELKRLRKLAPQIPFLIPGVGAQGGDLKDAVRFGCTSIGDLALINVGRSILYASQAKDFDLAARKEAAKIRDEMNRYRSV